MSSRTHRLHRFSPNEKQPETDTNVADLRRAAVFEVVAHMLETISKSPQKLTLSEFGIYSVVFMNDAKGKETHAKLIPKYLDMSSASISRKLNKLVSDGLIARRLEERVYYYSIPEHLKANFFLNEADDRLLSNLYETMSSVIKKATRE